jgi:predicted RNA-binding Zn-ribbon protein involved in translation (DUF1610 family)
MNSYTMNEAETHMAGATGARVVTITSKEVTDCDNCGEMNITDNDLCRDCRWVSKDKLEEWFDEVLDESNRDITIGTLTYSPSHVLKTVDSVAYRIGLSEHADYLAEDGYIVEGYTD